MKTVSDRIFELLKEKGMSQKEFAAKTGIAESTIRDWKKKKTMLQNLMVTQRITETEARKMLGI